MMDTNIFISKYKHENAWTERLMQFLANSNTQVLNSFFEHLDISIKVRSLEKVSFEMQEDEGKSIPDATISSIDDYFIIYFEMKTGKGFGVSQVENHLNALLKKGNQVKVLVIMTNDFHEPDEFTRFAQTHKRLPVKIKFVSWGDVANFIASVVKKEHDGKIKFLATQYGDYINKEVHPEMNWKGFDKDFNIKWEEFYKFRNEIKKLTKNEITTYIEHQIKGKWRKAKKSPYSEVINREYIMWILWKYRKSWIKLGFGFAGDDENLEDPILYLEFGWTKSIHESIKNSSRFIECKKKLEAKKFIFIDNWAERDIHIIELCNLSVNKQLKRIYNFIDRSMTIFEESGLIKLIKM